MMKVESVLDMHIATQPSVISTQPKHMVISQYFKLQQLHDKNMSLVLA